MADYAGPKKQKTNADERTNNIETNPQILGQLPDAPGDNAGNPVDLTDETDEIDTSLTQKSNQSKTQEENIKEEQEDDDKQNEEADSDDDNDPEVILLGGNSGAWPGLSFVTVAKRCRGDRVEFLNRYGPPAKAWHVWGDSPDDKTDQTKLLDLADNTDRIIDHNHPKSDRHLYKVRAGDVVGIKNIVWDYGDLAWHPLMAAELLNPDVVKKAGELSTMAKRRNYSKVHERLQEYPTTNIDVEWNRSMEFILKSNKEWKKTLSKDNRSWELGSKVRSLYKDQLNVEKLVYQAALTKAKNFTEWYNKRHGSEQRDRSPTAIPINLKSASPSPETVQEAEDEKKPTPSNEEEQDDAEELKRFAREGFFKGRGIDKPTKKDHRFFETYWEAMQAGKDSRAT